MMIGCLTLCGDLFIDFEPVAEFSFWFSIPGHLLKRVNFFTNILELKVSLQIHTIGLHAFKLFEIQLLLICRHMWHKLWFAYVFIMKHVHSPEPYKALKLEMTHTYFVYDKDLFTPWLRP